MKKNQTLLEKSCTAMMYVFLVLGLITVLAGLWNLSGGAYGLFCPDDRWTVYPLADGGWTVLAGRFAVLLPQGYFSPYEGLGEAAHTVFVIQMAMGVLAGVFQAMWSFLAAAVCSRTAVTPFARENCRDLLRIGVLLCLGAILPEVGKTVLMALLAGGNWIFFPDGFPFEALLCCGVLYMASQLFQYGSLLQQEYDQTL